ncbi:hypothetical protein XENOCAPTIV_024948 [Xenoophorus captivus]|uniref:Arrestin-like N-terminal domain-containing protein n=1 Tax=Xenoophorus captivus TaxID=1517983 RepID=A0ABV0QFK0_9TELE
MPSDTLRFQPLWCRFSYSQVELQDGVFDGRKHKADVLSVRGTGKVRVDDLVTVWVQVHKHFEDELPCCLSISLGT